MIASDSAGQAPGVPWATAVRRNSPLLVGLGCLAATAAAVAAVRTASVTESSPIRPEDAWSLVLRAAVPAALALYVLGIVLLRRRPVPLAAVLAIAAAVQLAPLVAPLLLSRDAYVYWDYGRLAAVHDANPYAGLPSRFPDDPAFERMGEDWQEQPVTYGPLFILATEGHAAVAGDEPGTATMLWKGIAAAGALTLALVAAAAAPQAAFAAGFVGWNPLLALHFAGGGHNDAWMMALVVGGIALGARGRRSLAGALWAASIAIKWFPLVLLPLELARDRGRARRVGLLGLGLGLAAIAAIATARYGSDWLRGAVPVGNQLRRANSLSLVAWLQDAGLRFRVAVLLLGGAFAVAYLWLLVQAWRGRVRLALAAGLFTLSLAWLAPWYATWSVSLAAIEEDRAARVLAVGLTAYLVMEAAFPLPG